MAQLTDDCFAFSGPLLPIEEMERLIEQRVAAVAETETVALTDARARVLAGDVVAPVSLPPFDNSAVDGYAVRHADLNADGETALKVVSRVLAGSSGSAQVGEGQAVRIFTGAPMPQGADTVFMQEDVQVEGDTVTVPKGLKAGANRRFAGEDVQAGSVVLSAGRILDVQHIALASALGLTKVSVRRRIRVAVFSTGDELVEPGSALSGAKIYDANRPLLREMLGRMGCIVDDLGILRDDRVSLTAAFRMAASNYDVVLSSGGVSTGEADYVRQAVEDIGTLVFWRVAIKPGRPVAMGVIRGGAGSDAAFVGLPGNPVAAFVTFARVVRPLILRMAGALPQKFMPLPVISTFDYKKKKGRREYVRVSLRLGADGNYEAVKHPQDGAGILTSLTDTDGLIEVPDDVTQITPGERVGFLSYGSLLG
jgi:molybdopterin molybdotransferase